MVITDENKSLFNYYITAYINVCNGCEIFPKNDMTDEQLEATAHGIHDARVGEEPDKPLLWQRTK